MTLAPPSRARARKLHVRDVLLLTTCAALLASATQVVDYLVRRHLLNEFTFTSPDVAWMAPVSNLVVVVPLFVLLGVVALVAPRRPALLLSGWLCAWYAAYATTLLFPRLYQIAMVLLSIGVAVRFAGALGADPDRWLSRIRRATVVMALSLATIAVATASWRTIRERRGMRALVEPPRGAPNVLLLILDTVRASSLDLYGYERVTAPEISRRAGEGAMFDWAIATSSWTLPSHGSLFTGRLPDELSARFLTPLDGTHPTLAEVLRDNGFATAGFVANHNYTTYESGLDRGFIHYEDYRTTFREAVLTGTVSRIDSYRDAWRSIFWNNSISGVVKAMLAHHFVTTVRFPDADRKDARVVTDEFLRWHESIGNRPFFAFVNYFDAHAPYRPPPPLRERFSANPQLIDLYDACIASIDHELSRLFQELERRGVLDSTIVIISSDHGEQFGEHGLSQHDNSLYTQLVRVPLVIRYPAKIPKGARIDRVVTLRDLPATILELAGVDMRRLSGISFASMLTRRERKESSPVVAELEDHTGLGVNQNVREMRALFDDSLHFIIEDGQSGQLFAYRTDPFELEDLASRPIGAVVLPRMHAELRRVTSPAPYVFRGTADLLGSMRR